MVVVVGVVVGDGGVSGDGSGGDRQTGINPLTPQTHKHQHTNPPAPAWCKQIPCHRGLVSQCTCRTRAAGKRRPTKPPHTPSAPKKIRSCLACMLKESASQAQLMTKREPTNNSIKTQTTNDNSRTTHLNGVFGGGLRLPS